MSERERRKCLEVLGVPHDASDDDIKKNYYKLAKQYHPDKNTEPGAKERFQEIGYAYKYLTEGPHAVGAEDEDDGIPFEVFVRLFPWLNGAFNPFGNSFGSPFGNPFFEHIHYGGHSFHREHHYGGHRHGGHHYHDYEEAFFPGFYDDSGDSDYDDYSYTRPSTYVPGSTKEEKKKEKKKKAKERRKAAKMGKQSHAAFQAKSNSSRNTSDSQQTSKQTTDRTDSSTSAPNNFTNVFPTHNSNAPDSCAPDSSSAKKVEQEKFSNGSILHKNKVSGTEKVKDTLRAEDVKAGGHDSSGASVGITSQNAHGKKSKKKLKAEQKQREKEMELIAAEFKRKQKEQEEKEAQRRAVRQERKERETTLGGQDLDESVVDNDSVITGNDSESVEDVDADDEAAAAMEDVDDDQDGDLEIDGIEDGQDRSARSRGEKDKQFMTHNMSSMQASGKTDVSNGGHARQKTSSRPVPQHQQQHGATPKTYHHDNRGSSRGGGADVKEESLKRHRKKYKPQEFEEDPEVDGVHGSAYSVLMPQSEAEEMRMFHEALLRSQMEAEQQDDFENVAADGTGVMPQTEAEEQAMLQAALRQSQTANWHGNIQTLDDVSDGDDSIFSGGSSGRDSGRSSGTLWHSSIGKNSKRQENSEMSSPQLRGSRSRPNLGGLGTGSCGFGSTISGDRGASTGTADHVGRGASGKHDQFDRTVGGRVKGKDRKAPEHGGRQDEAWEFGGSKLGPSFKSDNADGIQFGFDDEGGAEIQEKHFQTFYNSNYKSDQDEGKNGSSNTFPVDAQTKTGRSQNAAVGQIGPGHTDNNTPQVSVLDGYQKIPPPPVPNISKLQTSSEQSEAQNRSHSSSVPVHQDSLYKSSHTSAVQSAATSASTSAMINDMDDIDDVDTFEESNAATFSYPSQPSSSFSLDIPSAMCNKERMKSYYNLKK
ncbi:uncharacterized protein [Haliotis cracherodii]|uniref:uncharacterized protein n=1 Tax=Haliotis cracherodii TaxID=6455 RepID=UPI0039EBADE0